MLSVPADSGPDSGQPGPSEQGLFLQAPGPAARTERKSPPQKAIRPAPRSRNPQADASVALEIPRGPYYVGQSIDAKVAAIAGAARPTLSLGTSANFELVALGGVEVMPLASSTIGNATSKTNLYRFPVRIVARRAGNALVLPSIQVSTDEGKRTVAPRTLSVATPPSDGRTGAFLGGVGRVKSVAAVEPPSIRLGETFEYRLKLEGAGSLGSTVPLAGAILGANTTARVDVLPIDRTFEPPTAVIRLRIRPDRPGMFSIPPFLVATFDPATRKYQTTASNGVGVRVVDVPNFDPGLAKSMPVRASGGTVAIGAGLAGLAFAASLLCWSRFRRNRSQDVDPRAVAEDLVCWLSAEGDESIGRGASFVLAEFFRRVGERPPGVLTPDEARGWSLQLGGPTTLADRVAGVIASSDRQLYGAWNPATDAADVRAAVCEILRELAACARLEKPREAPAAA